MIRRDGRKTHRRGTPIESSWHKGPRRGLLRLAMTAFQRVRIACWSVTRPRAFGVHALARTRAGEVLLVRHTYDSGWRLPGGGIKRGEAPRAAILRELREEIGMHTHGSVREALVLEHRPQHRRGLATLFVVDDVEFAPTPSLEIDAVACFPPNALPPDATPLTLRLIDAILLGETYVIEQGWREEADRPRRHAASDGP
jgi:ADP-ribose pyrophosphatase YjhB (NUDIX family)